MQKTRKAIAALIAVTMLLTGVSSVFAAVVPGNAAQDSVLENTQSESVAPDTEVMIMVEVEGDPALLRSADLESAKALASTVISKLPAVEKRIEAALGTGIEVEDSYGLLFNGFSFRGEYWMLGEINKLDGVTAFIPMEFTNPVEKDGTVNPQTATSAGTIGAEQVWELGYTGAGSVIAILDSGILSTHEAFSVMPEEPRFTVEYLQSVIDQYGSVVHFGTDASQLYYNAKLAFNWDYFDDDYTPNHTSTDHGTHVAGIAAGNNGADFKGIAPDAQLAVFQVFEDNGSAYFSTILSAMEDCVYLGVDSVNMSLGTPAGFTDPAYIGLPNMDAVCDSLEAAGVSINVAAGNDSHNLKWTTFGNFYSNTYRTLTTNPDYGMVGAPATFDGSFAVGSVVNSDANIGHLEVNGKDFNYGVVGGITGLGAIPGEYTVVYAGLGSVEEFEALGESVTNSIAVVQRGTLTFSEKCTNAEAAGAAGIIIFNNAAGSFNPSVQSNIPLGIMTMSEGEAVVAELGDDMQAPGAIVGGINHAALSMASSSSWGTTADLKIKPEISAPGDDVNSAVGDGDAAYEIWSGTSMATPHIAAAMAMIKQRLVDIFPNADAATITNLAYTFAMNTANQVSGFVRQQGAGIIDVYAAVTTDTYVTVDGCDRPKLELDDSETGEFTFTVTLHNFGANDRSYTVEIDAMAEAVVTQVFSGTWVISSPSTEVDLTCLAPNDVSSMVENDAPELITVPAGGETTVTMTISANADLMAYYDEYFPVGSFLEGFVRFVAVEEDAQDLSIPFLGYVGDWDEPSMLDRGYYWDVETGNVCYSQFISPGFNIAGYGMEQYLGINQYASMVGQTYLSDRNAVSPNGDGILDEFNYIQYQLLRNASLVKLLVEDAEGNVIDTLYTAAYQTKDYYGGGFGSSGESWHDILIDYDWAALEENETVYLVLETWLDHEEYRPEDNESGRWVIPVTKDTQAPEIAVTETGISVIDENYVAYYGVYSDAELTNLVYETGVYAAERNVASEYATDLATYYVSVADYAGNEAVYEINNGIATVISGSILDRGRQIVGYATENYATNRCENAWISFNIGTNAYYENLTEPEIKPIDSSFFGGEYAYHDASVDNDGIVYVVESEAGLMGAVSTLNIHTFELERVWEPISSNGSACKVTNIGFDPETNECIVVYRTTNYGGLANDNHVGKLDLATGEITYLFTPEDMFNQWGMDVMESNRICMYDTNSNLYVYDYEGNVVQIVEMPDYDPQYGASHVGVKGYTGCLLYDETTNSVIVSSHWSWLGYNMYATGGVFRYDFDTNTFAIHRIGNGGGRVINGMFFLDEVNTDPVYLTGCELDKYETTLTLGTSDVIDFIGTPSEANAYELVWTSSDESIATVSGNNSMATITAGVIPGECTVTCTVMVDGEVFDTLEVAVTTQPDLDLAEALNVEDGNLMFVSAGSYPFVAVQSDDRYYAMSTNNGVADSESSVTTTIDMTAGETLTFEYKVGSEVDFDYFRFYANGEKVFEDSGTDKDWTSYTYTAAADGEYVFEWTFEKDPAVEDGFDGVYLDNVDYSGDDILLGDVNLNGILTMDDALLLIRHNLGLMTLSDEALAVADMNGDGVIDMTDALLIARAVLSMN